MNSAERLEVLVAIQPLGDELGARDAGAAREWAAEVAAACEGQPDRPVRDAAMAALTAR